MTHWNHRVVQTTSDDGEVYQSVCEVFYNDDGSIWGYTEANIAGATRDELVSNAEQVFAAIHDIPPLIDPICNREDDE